VATLVLGWNDFVAATDSNNSGVMSMNGWFQTGPSVADFTGLVASGFSRIDSLSGAGTRSQKCRMTIYGDAGGFTGPSTTLIGVTDEVIISQATTLPAWIEFPGWTNFGGAPSATPLTKYWVGFWFGTVVASANALVTEDIPGPAAAHSFFNLAVTYSTTANPVVASWTDSGGFQTYSSYFNYEGGTPGFGGSAQDAFIGAAG
jgi:hypothetical protein